MAHKEFPLLVIFIMPDQALVARRPSPCHSKNYQIHAVTPTDRLDAITKCFDRFCFDPDRYGLLLPRKTTKTAVKAAVAANISLFLAAVKRARHNENNAVIPAMIPIRANVFSTKYNTVTPAIGSTEETTVATREDSFVMVRSE